MRSVLVVFGLLVACGSDDSVPNNTAGNGAGNVYAGTPDTTVTIGPAAAPGNGNVVVGTNAQCKSGEHADVIVDSTGKVVATVCAPASTAPTPIDGQGNIDIGKDNKGVVAIDGNDDGIDVAGDVKSDGNNVTVYGAGPAVSVIGGNIDGDGNNFTARGVTVKGNVTIDGNNATMLLSIVEGDLVIKGNNAVVASCTVLGKVVIEGNNAILVGNKVSKGIEPGEHNATCDGNTDAGGVAITCAAKK